MLLPLDMGRLRAVPAPFSLPRDVRDAPAHLNPRGDWVLTQPLQQFHLGAPLVTAKTRGGGIALWHAPKCSMS